MKLTKKLFLFACFFSLPLSAATRSAEIFDVSGSSVGTVKLTETKKGVKFDIKLAGAKPGTRAMHIHEFGKCEGPKFESAGSHFNPMDKQHGRKNPKGAHAGDLPNITIKESGSLNYEVVSNKVTLKEGQKNSLSSPKGSALVIHEQPDDDKTNPSGNAGDRIYCAVLFPQTGG